MVDTCPNLLRQLLRVLENMTDEDKCKSANLEAKGLFMGMFRINLQSNIFQKRI